ncbi:MAG: hypothetical protein R3C10_12235 [Pirellulales bacterium]|nr:hypothetical protein [Planctomycetales bacterium]
MSTVHAAPLGHRIGHVALVPVDRYGQQVPPSIGAVISGDEYTGAGPQVGHDAPRRQQEHPLDAKSRADKADNTMSFFIFLFSAP